MTATSDSIHDKIIVRYKNRMKRLAKKRTKRELRQVYSTIARELDSLLATANDSSSRRKKR